MEELVKGDVIVLNFPFSDLSSARKRPAIILAVLEGDDYICCQITSSRIDKYSIEISDQDFKIGKLNRTSYVRPNKLFTADKSIINYKIGPLKKEKVEEIFNKLIEILKK